MKKHLILSIIFSLSTLISTLGQGTKKSLNYQAVILDPKAIDIPGASLSGQPLSKGKVCLKFSFVNAQGNVDYEETQQTTTDEYGLVSLAVGTGTYNGGTNKNFESIVWDANVKSMRVAVSYDGCTSFKQVSTQALNYTPYALYAEAVDYKNVKDAPTKLSQFSNDAGFLIPKDLDPLKADIKTNTADIKTNTADIKTNTADIKINAGQIASANQSIADNKKSSDESFLVVNQSISDLGTKVTSNTNSIVTIEGKINEQQNIINDTRNQLNTTTNTINNQINGLQYQVTTTANTVNSLSNEYQTVANKSTSTNLGGASPSDQLYPSQKAAKSYVDNAIYNAVGTGVADATTLAPGKVRLAGDLAGTANAPTVPALANKENTSNKSTNVTTDGNSDIKYPSAKAVKSYVDQATQGIALQAAVDAKADKNSPVFTGTPNLPTGTIAVTQNGADNSTKIATTAFVQQATAAGIIDASSTTKGKLKLSGDLGGTAESPTVPGLALKANSSEVNSALALKEDASNKSTATSLGTSDAFYPSQKAVKTYVDAQIASATIADADASTKGKIQLAGDLGGTAALPTVPGLALKANSADVNTSLALKAPINNPTFTGTVGGITSSMVGLGNVDNTSDANKPVSTATQTALDLKAPLASPTFTGTPSLPTGTTAITQSSGDNSTKLATTEFVTTKLAAGAPDATTTATGKVQLAGDLGGTASSPTVPGLALKANISDVNSALALKANSADVTTSLALKEDASNKSIATALGTSDAFYPSQKAVKTYVDNAIYNAVGTGVADATTLAPGKVQLAGDLAGTATAPTVPGLALKANTSDVSSALALKANTSDVTSSLGLKENSSNKSTSTSLGTSNALYPSQKAVKSYVDSTIASANISMGTIAGTSTANGASITSRVLNLAPADGTNGGIVTTGTQTIAGAKTFTTDAIVNGITVGRGKGNLENNTAMGFEALNASGLDVTGAGNTAIGRVALNKNKTGAANVAVGQGSLFTNVVGGSNTAIGYDALRLNVGSENTGVGRDALKGSISGTTKNTAIGFYALRSMQNSSTGFLTGSGNTAVGSNSGENISSGNDNTTIGKNSGNGINVGSYNTTVGVLAKVSDGVSNATAIGFNAGAGNNGIAIGNSAYASLSENATAIGSGANAAAENSTAIGRGTLAQLSNSTAIGFGAEALTENTITLGNTDITNVKTSGTLTAGAVTYPNTDGTIGQVLLTDGNGLASFGSIPTLNQSTTGSAATLTTLRTIHGGSFDGSANVTNIIASTYGGTGNGFTKFSGPTSSEKTFTLPDADATILTSNTTVTIAQGGTGTNNGSITGTSALTFAAGGTNQNVSILASGTGSVGVGTSSPSSSSALDVSSSTKGFLPPRMTTAQRNAITSPTEGLTLWNTENKQLEVYNGTYWVTMDGKLVSPINVGESYGGGKVAYIFTSSDLGYVAGQTHGLIAAVADQTTDAGIPWFPDKFYGATVTGIGLGLPNTISIIAAAVVLGKTDMTSYAAGLANNYKGGGYNDWFLPSRDELNKLFINRAAIGGFATTGTMATYWSSSQKGSMNFSTFTNFANGISSAYQQFFFAYNGNPEGTQNDLGISNSRRVRAVRIF